MGLIGLTAVATALLRTRAKTLDRGLGQRMSEFVLVDIRTEKLVALADYRGRAKAIVITFTGIDCPIGNLYLPRLAELSALYAPRGVAFLAINSNSHETIDQICAHARDYAIPFPVLRDEQNRIADRYLVERTCETLVLDGGLRLRYRGAIDDQYEIGSRKDEPRQNYLIASIESVLDGRTVAVATTHVVGCPIDRADPRARPKIAPLANEIRSLLDDTEPTVDVGEVTYAADVAPILHQKCAPCHRAGQGAPFSLLTHQDATRWAASIWEVTTARWMPPWQADPRFGKFANDRSLTPRERAVLMAWVEHGAPLGDLRATPPQPEFPAGWTIGTPDLVFEVGEAYKVKAEGTLPLQHFRVTTGLKENVWVQSAEVRPGDRAVVHHAFVYIDDHARGPGGRALPERYLTGYAPGDMPSVFPPGVARKIPVGADLSFEVHYTPIGQERFDRTAVGLILAKQPPAHEAITRGVSQRGLCIPPGAKNHAERSSWTFPFDAHLLAMTPHLHLRGTDFTYTATYPDGRSEVLLAVPHFDFNWQSAYRLLVPTSMPKGTRIDCLAHYDNSADNHANPDPGAYVSWGERTVDKMMIGYIDYYIDAQAGMSSRPAGGE
jgi:peroxiredoxin